MLLVWTIISVLIFPQREVLISNFDLEQISHFTEG